MIQIIKNLETKTENIVKRAYVSRSLVDAKESGVTQVSYFEKTGLSEGVSPYGLSVRLPEGIQVVLFAVQGQENNRACIGYAQENRFKNLEPGEVVVGIPGSKTFIKFDKDGNITIEGDAKITVNSKGDIDIDSSGKINITSSGDVDVDAPKVNLGTGGAQIARIGDTVAVTVGGTPGTGTITSGGVNTSI